MKNLNSSGAEPDENEQCVTMKASEDVAFAMQLAAVDLIEQSHENERIEY